MKRALHQINENVGRVFKFHFGGNLRKLVGRVFKSPLRGDLGGLLFFIVLSVNAQVSTQLTHYSVDAGLSENHVLCMLQDQKGAMWFGTYDGLNKFDGYTFRNFKGRPNQKYQLVNYRTDRIKQDRQGFIWVQTNDGRFYRFDPANESFLPVPQCIPEYKNYKNPLNRITVLANGSIWLYNSDAGNEDCFKVENIGSELQIKLQHIAKQSDDSRVERIFKVYLDQNGNTWMLTSKGISLIRKGSSSPTQLFTENEAATVFSISENQSNIYLGGERGKLRVYNKAKGTLDLIATDFVADIIDIQQLNAQELFLLTSTADFYVYNVVTGTFQYFRVQKQGNSPVYGCFKDRSNNVWIEAGNQAAVLFDTRTKTLNYFSVQKDKYASSQTSLFYIVEDKYDNIWMQLRGGGFYKYNKKLKCLEPIPSGNACEESISDMVHTGMTDSQGNLWLGTYLQGVDKVVFRHSPFTFTKPFQVSGHTLNNEIRCIFQDKKRQLWVASKSGFVYVYNEKRQLKGMLGSDGKLNSKVPLKAPVYGMTEDHTGAIWLGTKGMGLFRLDRKSDESFSLTNFQYDPKDIYSLSSNLVYTVFEDHLRRIWVGTFFGGLNLLDVADGKIRFINSRNKLRNYPINNCSKVRYIAEDKQNQLYFCTTQGLVVCKSEQKKPEEMAFYRYAHNPDDAYSLSGNDVHYLLNSSRGDLYLALIGGGINVLKGGFSIDRKPKFEVLRNNDGTASNLVYTIKEDTQRNLWMSAQTQLIKYNPATSKFDSYKPVAAGNYFLNEAAVCQTTDGELLYGTSDGFVTFDPRTIHHNRFVPNICLTQLQIFNKEVLVDDTDSPLQQTIDQTSELTLNHRQNTFSIGFAALDYTNPQAIQYAYKLEGLETDWNYVGNQRMATYINLPKGRYVFHVKSTNADGEWVNNEKTIVIVKLPSFWESVWGLFFYIVLFILFSALVAYVLFTIYRLRNEVAVEQRITSMKLRFFTDISHELRTPLTLIASPVENLLKKEPLTANVKEQLQIVQKNTARMMRLINQILDFRKIQNEKMKLLVEEIDVVSYLQDICLNFTKLAEDKNIALNLLNHTANAKLWVDKDKFEKIIFNLLSNAFKFSKPDCRVDVEVTDDTDHVYITVTDEGVGIRKDRLKLLFQRFESFAAPNTGSPVGTGIGLSLTKELVELHQGRIDVESEYGKGSAFKVTFQKGFQHIGPNNEFLLQDANAQSDDKLAEMHHLPQDELNNVENQPKTERASILIVEDNGELRAFLKSALSQQYEILEAQNGRDALRVALLHMPDLIISDIMMPDMDGIALARAIKQDLNTSHIPLILLTAKTDIETKLEAMKLCVDDYITKPFSLTYLEARVENLLTIRVQLQSYFKATLTSGVITISKPDVTSADDQFLRKTMDFLEANYENPKMNIDDIAVSAGVSRSSFFKKIKSLTGLAPVDLIREFRIQKAVQLIEIGETNISQIAYSVGIIDTRYFSRCFKEKFGMNPSEYKNKMKQ